jgi:sulfatase maturation enzyme AslB (radical SAM superfamily)
MKILNKENFDWAIETAIRNNKLEDIGFYTLSDSRALQSSEHSPLWRCELILTDRCNFKCPYCRGLRNDILGEMPYENALSIVNQWINEGLQNVRFSGGEPTFMEGKCHDKMEKSSKG